MTPYLDSNLSFRDFLSFCKQIKWRTTLFFIVSFILIGMVFFFSAPTVTFFASFRDGSELPTPPSSFEKIGIESNISPPKNEGIFLLKSSLLIQPLIQKLGFQATIRKSFLKELQTRFKENFSCDLLQKPFKKKCFFLHDLVYEGLKKRKFILSFEESGGFVLLDKKKQFLQRGKIHEPFKYQDLSFLIEDKICHEDFQLILEPLSQCLEKVKSHLRLKQDKNCSEMISATFEDSSSKRAEQFLNLLIEGYIHYLKEENRHFAKEKDHFIQAKIEDAQEKLDRVSKEYQDLLKENPGSETGSCIAELLQNLYQEKGSVQDQLRVLQNSLVDSIDLPSVTQKEPPNDVKGFLEKSCENPSKPTSKFSHACFSKKTGFDKTKQMTQTSSSESTVKKENVQPPLFPKSEVHKTKGKKELGQKSRFDESKISDKRYPLIIEDWENALTGNLGVYLQDLCSSWLKMENEKESIQEWDRSLVKHSSMKKGVNKQRENQKKLISLQLAKKRYAFYQNEWELLQNKIDQCSTFLFQLAKDPESFELFSYILDDPLSRHSLDNIASWKQNVEDQLYLTEKEKDRWQEEIKKEKSFLKKQLHLRKKWSKLEQDKIEKNISYIKTCALEQVKNKMTILENEIGRVFEKIMQKKQIQKQELEAKLENLEEQIAKKRFLLLEEKRLLENERREQMQKNFWTKERDKELALQQSEKISARLIDKAAWKTRQPYAITMFTCALALFFTFSYCMVLFFRSVCVDVKR